MLSLIAGFGAAPHAAWGAVKRVSVGRVPVAADGVPVGVVKVVRKGERATPTQLTLTLGEWGGEAVGRYVETGCGGRGLCRRAVPVAAFLTRAGTPVRLKPLTLYLVVADEGPVGSAPSGLSPVFAAFLSG